MKELPDPSQPTYPSFYLDLASLKEEATTSLEMAGETLLSFIEMAENYGSEKTISSLEIYPKSFSEKKAFLSALDTYNAKHLNEVDKVVYTDFGGMFQGTLDSYLSLIYLVLGIFAGVSLAVTILLVGLLSHNAVSSRRKEIGLLRSLGASRHAIEGGKIIVMERGIFFGVKIAHLRSHRLRGIGEVLAPFGSGGDINEKIDIPVLNFREHLRPCSTTARSSATIWPL